MTAATWSPSAPAFGGYFEHATLAGRRLMIRQTVNGRWVARVDGKPVGGSYASAQAARVVAERAA